MGEGFAAIAGPGVGDERNAAHVESDPAGRDALEDGGHADGVTTETGQHPDLGRGLVGRSGQADVDSSSSPIPSVAAAACRRSRSRGFPASVRSGKRGPSSSALGPIGDWPVRLM